MSEKTSGNSSSLKNFFDLSDGNLSSSLNRGTFGSFGCSVEERPGSACAVADVVVASRVRLFRNLSDYPFPEVCSTDQKKAVAQKIANSLASGLADDPDPTAPPSTALIPLPAILSPEQLETLERQCLIEFQAVIDAMAQGVWSGAKSGPASDNESDKHPASDSSWKTGTLSSKDIHDGETVELSAAEEADSGTIEFRDLEEELGVVRAADAESRWAAALPESDYRKQILVAIDPVAFESHESQPATDDVEDTQSNETHAAAPSHGDGRVMLAAVVNEEDHLQMQAMSAGVDLQLLWHHLSQVDDRIQTDSIDFAFSQQWGFLTACPANVGTAMRAGVTLHLPALAFMGRLDNLFRWLMRGGISAEGIYGDDDSGDTAWGDFYRVGNQMTLGISEPDLLRQLTVVVPVIVAYEREARRLLVEGDPLWMRRESESAARALQLQVQRSDKEMLLLVSALRLGILLGNVSHEQVGRVCDAFSLSRLKQQLQFAIDQEQYDIATACRDRISEIQERGNGN